MKKLVGTIVLLGIAAVSYSYEEAVSNLASIEASYQALKAEEGVLIEQKRVEATAAQSTLDEQKRVYAELRQRQSKIEWQKKSKYYKREYSDLAKQYGNMRKELESEMKDQQVVVDEYNQLVSQ
jgi:hypothetical protein